MSKQASTETNSDVFSNNYLCNNYGPRDTTLVKGLGCELWDDEGRRYLDALAGIAVCNLGHAHPGVTAAICDQAQTLLHVSNYFNIEPQQALAHRLCQLSGLARAFFCNSGTEANEAAIKIARRHGHARGIKLPHIIVAEQSFHGRTLAALSATGNKAIQQGFEPLVEGFIRVPFDDLDAVAALAARDDIAAVLVEPIQGEGGVRVPKDDYLPGLRALCDANHWLLMLDEVQTGCGRTGEMFAFQHSGIEPDVLSLAKALGNGVPIGASVMTQSVAELLGPGSHGSTFGGNPLACRAGLAVVDALQSDNLLTRVKQLGADLQARLGEALKDCQQVVEIRGRGLMLGIELQSPCAELVAKARAQGLIINVTATKVIRLLPPLIFNDSHCDELIEKLTRLILDFDREVQLTSV